MARYKSNFRKIAMEAPQVASEALLQTGKDLYDVSQQLVPVDTGKLKASGGVEVIDSETVHVGYGIPGSEREDVALYQEFGTVNMPAQPYLRPAAMMAESTFRARMLEAMAKRWK